MGRFIRVFSKTQLTTHCDVCGRWFDLVSGGACVRCRKALCARHLHGSWLRRLMVDMGAESVCCACRADR